MFRNLKLETFTFLLFRLLTIAIFCVVLFVFFFIIYQGYSRISWPFLTEYPREGMMKGGIFPAIYGTFILVFLTCCISFPFGLLAGIYLAEYAKNPTLKFISQVMTQNLAGIPSIVFGLFGLAFFVRGIGLGVNILSGSLTLAVLVLPVIVKTTEESLNSIDQKYRLTSYALGASKTATTFQVVLPMALPSIITSFILSIGRIAGETAAILFTAVAFFVDKVEFDLSSQVMALPYHVYIMATTGVDLNASREIAFATAIVLLLIIFLLNLVVGLFRRTGERNE